MRYLSGSIDDREYGIPLSQVREVIAFPEISRIPNMPADFLGIMNLRESIIPVLDLRRKFGAPQILTHETAVIICSLERGQVGLVVDCIHGVCAPSEQDVRSLEHFGAEVLTSHPGLAVVAKEGRLVLIIDVALTLSASEAELEGMRKTLGQEKKSA